MAVGQMNHPALCAVPGISILLKNASVNFSTADVARLRDNYGKTSPTGPSITSVLSGRRLVKRNTATALVEIVKDELAAKGAHVCAACTRILEYNTTVQNFSAFVQQLAARRENARSDVVATIAIGSGYSEEAILELIKKKTAPNFVSSAVLASCHTHYGDQAYRLQLAVTSLLPQECKPLTQAADRQDVAVSYLAKYCRADQGCG
jgi:hypothetical protein